MAGSCEHTKEPLRTIKFQGISSLALQDRRGFAELVGWIDIWLVSE